MKIKRMAAFIACIFTFGLPYAWVAGNPATSNADQIHRGVGVIETIDAIKGTVTMEHDPIESLNWPKMVMTFTTKDPAQLKDLREGDQVEFDLVQSEKVYLITRIERMR
ncbi:copper-binding protein [Desulfosarcina sp.]|uniref:copper-binding protein n=1 Tax=Desulfosarcina sp. TaxID=2027861 RepID=UPI00356ACB70